MPTVPGTFSIAHAVAVTASVVIHAGVAAGLVAAGRGGPSAASSVEYAVDVGAVLAEEAPRAADLEEEDTVTAAAATATTVAAATATAPSPPSPPSSPVSPVAAPSHDGAQHDAPPHEAAPGEAAPHEPLPLTHAAPTVAAPERSAGAPPRFEMSTSTVGAIERGGPSGRSAGRPESQEGGGTLLEAQVSVRARLVASAPATYPRGARDAEIEADVPLEIVVSEAGAVIEARALGRAGSGFDEAAAEAVRAYRFAPALRDGRPVRVRMRWSVAFRLR